MHIVAWLAVFAVALPLVRADLLIPAAYLDPAAACEPFSNATKSCTEVISVGTPIYVNSTWTQADQDALAQSLIPTIGVVRNVDLTCGNALYLYLCASAFMPCTYYNLSTNGTVVSYALPNYTCPSMCNYTNTVCAAVYTQFGQPPQPCAPVVAYDFSAEGGDPAYAPDCSTGWSNSQNVCPSSCPIPTYQDVDNCCLLHCPIGQSLMGDTTWNALLIIYQILTWASVVLCLVVGILYTANPLLRKFPGWLVIACGFGIGGANFGLAMTSFYGVDGMQCPSPPPSAHSAACWAQGFINVFFAQMGVSFWLAMNVVTFAVVFSPNPMVTMALLSQYQWAFTFFMLIPVASTWAAGAVSVARAGYAFGPNGLLPWCSVYSFSALHDFFSIPILVEICIGSVLWLAGMAKILWVWWQNRASSKGGLNMGMHAAIIAFEVACILTVGLLTFIFVGVYPYISNDLPGQLVAYVSGASPDPPDTPVGALFVLSMCVGLSGVLFGLIFGLRRGHIDFVRSKFNEFTGASSTTTAATAASSSATGAASNSKSKSSFGVYSITSDAQDDGAESRF